MLAGLFAVLWVVVTLWPGGGSPAPEAEPPTASANLTQAADTDPSGDTSQADDAKQAAAQDDGRDDGPVEVRLTSGSGACDPTTVRVTPTVREGQRSRKPVEVGLVMSTTSDKPCTLTPKDADLIMVISANKRPVWDSTVCKQSPLTKPIELSPRWATLVLTEWSGRGSGTNCSRSQGWAPGGDYTVQAGTLGGEPGKTTFKLKAAPKPKPTETKKPRDDQPEPKPKTSASPVD